MKNIYKSQIIQGLKNSLRAKYISDEKNVYNPQGCIYFYNSYSIINMDLTSGQKITKVNAKGRPYNGGTNVQYCHQIMWRSPGNSEKHY